MKSIALIRLDIVSLTLHRYALRIFAPYPVIKMSEDAKNRN